MTWWEGVDFLHQSCAARCRTGSILMRNTGTEMIIILSATTLQCSDKLRKTYRLPECVLVGSTLMALTELFVQNFQKRAQRRAVLPLIRHRFVCASTVRTCFWKVEDVATVHQGTCTSKCPLYFAAWIFFPHVGNVSGIREPAAKKRLSSLSPLRRFPEPVLQIWLPCLDENSNTCHISSELYHLWNWKAHLLGKLSPAFKNSKKSKKNPPSKEAGINCRLLKFQNQIQMKWDFSFFWTEQVLFLSWNWTEWLTRNKSAASISQGRRFPLGLVLKNLIIFWFNFWQSQMYLLDELFRWLFVSSNLMVRIVQQNAVNCWRGLCEGLSLVTSIKHLFGQNALSKVKSHGFSDGSSLLRLSSRGRKLTSPCFPFMNWAFPCILLFCLFCFFFLCVFFFWCWEPPPPSVTEILDLNLMSWCFFQTSDLFIHHPPLVLLHKSKLWTLDNQFIPFDASFLMAHFSIFTKVFFKFFKVPQVSCPAESNSWLHRPMLCDSKCRLPAPQSASCFLKMLYRRQKKGQC